MKRQLMAIAGMSAALVLGTAGVASAHECYVKNRSAQGNAAAGANSPVWETITVAGFVNSPDFAVEFPGVDPACWLDYWSSHGGPDSFTVRIDKTIGEGSSNPNLANGKGLEHIEEAYGPLAGEAASACM